MTSPAPDLTHYTEEHRLELERLLTSPPWQAALSSGLVEEVKAERIEPHPTRNFIDTVVTQLLAFNEPTVKELIARGCKDQNHLCRKLAHWPPRLDGKDPTLSFLGLNLTSACNLEPKCAYCNQPSINSPLHIGRWKAIIEEVTAHDGAEGVYIYMTGGEPLTLREEVWGDDGLVRFATERGAGVNVNTNATLLTPEIALRFVKAGLAKLHISLDAADKEIQDGLRGAGQFERTLKGIYNVQLARDLVGAGYPVIHTNCVLTNRNLGSFPALLAFIVEKHKQTVDREDPFYNDLFPHVIPVGGSTNEALRPSDSQFRRFYEDIWPQACQVWDSYQDRLGVTSERRGALFGYFSNPFLRVKHSGGLEAYAKASAEGRYGRLALSKQCYVAPTQVAVTPDGNQYRCGSHAIRGILPIGNVRERGVLENIREGIDGLGKLPREEECYGCALATLYINQAVEAKLKEKVESLRQEGKGPAG